MSKTHTHQESGCTDYLQRNVDSCPLVTAGARQKSAKSTLESIKLACLAYEALQPLNNISWTSHREKLLSLCKAEERDHRGFMSDFTSCHTADTASVSDA